jgi:hypothetical protein
MKITSRRFKHSRQSSASKDGFVKKGCFVPYYKPVRLPYNLEVTTLALIDKAMDVVFGGKHLKETSVEVR